MITPAIVAVGYNRPEAMKRLLASIENADYRGIDNITLIVSIDECEASNAVEQVAQNIKWEHGNFQIRRFKERQGLRRHIIQCGDLSEQYGAVIILEDDLLVSPSFYKYVYEAINFYENDSHICGVSLYSHAWNGYAGLEFKPMQNEYDVYMGQYSISWGQCWSAQHWKSFKEWYVLNEDKLPVENSRLPKSILTWSNQSWGKYFALYLVEKGLYYVVPYISFSTNFSEIGQHCSQPDSSFQVSLLSGEKSNFLLPPFEKAVKYDIFFEREFSDYEIAGINGSDICVNLNLSKLSTLGKRFILSPAELEYKKIASFSMNMHPIDANIVYNVPGDGIFLYDCEKDGGVALSAEPLNWKRLHYDMRGYWWNMLLQEGKRRFFATVKQKMDRIKGKYKK